MDEERIEPEHGKAAGDTPGGRLAAGFALDLAFCVVLVVVASITSNFDVALLITMCVIVALWGAVRIAYNRAKRLEAERLNIKPRRANGSAV
jgi:hypothetical protein